MAEPEETANVTNNSQEMQVEFIPEPNDEVQVIDVEENPSSDGPAKKKKKVTEEEERNIPNISLDDSVSDEQKCSICLDMWSNYGEHRLCCLKCGHLFGLSCIKKWLEPLRTADRRCPECNTKASKRDIRVLYAKKLIATDTAELEKVKQELEDSERKRVVQEQTINYLNTRIQAYASEISNSEAIIANLKKLLDREQTRVSSFLTNVSNIDISSEGQCRVMAYNAWHRTLIATTVAHSQRANVDEHGYRKVILDTMSASTFIPAHSKSIRDITFSSVDPNIGLSVGFDAQAVLFDVRSCSVMHKYKQANTMFWSCCWSKDNGNNFYVGTQHGHILKYDLRNLSGSLETVENLDRSPVASLASVSEFMSPHYGVSGFISCNLNSCYAYMQHGGAAVSHRLNIKGPFMSVRFDDLSKHALVSCRPNSANMTPHVRHYVCIISKDSQNEPHCQIVHTLNGGTTQQRLSRPCHVYLPDDTLVAASNESTKSVQLWSITSGEKVHELPVSAPVIDTCSFRNDDVFLAMLTPHKIMIYKHEAPSQSL